MLKSKLVLTAMLLSLPLLSIATLSGCASEPMKESTGEYLDDSAITVKVKSSFLAEKGLKSYPISVETYKGVVELSGFVDSDEQKRNAADIASRVNGVVSVTNGLIVKKH